MGMVDGHRFGKPFRLSKNKASCQCYFLVKIRTIREIYNTKRAKSEHAVGYGIEPKNSAGCGICLNFLGGQGIRTPASGAPESYDSMDFSYDYDVLNSTTTLSFILRRGEVLTMYRALKPGGFDLESLDTRPVYASFFRLCFLPCRSSI